MKHSLHGYFWKTKHILCYNAFQFVQRRPNLSTSCRRGCLGSIGSFTYIDELLDPGSNDDTDKKNIFVLFN